jgi:hypothetical protein
MNLAKNLWLSGAISLLCACTDPKTEPAAAAPPVAKAESTHYSMDDFARVRKLDAHVHVNVADPAFLEQAAADGFELMSINVDYPDFPKLADQRAAALTQLKADPEHFHWATTFSMQGFGKKAWAEKVNASVAFDAAAGAKAVKIWKNVGMKERDGGKLVMLNDARISPVAEQVQKLGITLIGHQGEPHNCWLPLDQMTTDNDREYFQNHPQYHMFLHPEMPAAWSTTWTASRPFSTASRTQTSTWRRA